MKMFAALRQEDIAELRRAEKNARIALDDPKVFEDRMQSNAIFANLYQNDRRVSELFTK